MFNQIIGTDGRDALWGSTGADWITTGDGNDFNIDMGEDTLTDVLSVGNSTGTKAVRNFDVTRDKIDLGDMHMMQDVVIKEFGGSTFITSGGLKIKLIGVSNEDFYAHQAEIFDAPALEEEPEPGVIVIRPMLGQSPSVGATSFNPISTSGTQDNAFLVGYEDAIATGRGWRNEPIDNATYTGFAPVTQTFVESPIAGFLNHLALHTDDTVVGFNTGQGGSSIEELSREVYLENFRIQLTNIRDEAAVLGREVDMAIQGTMFQGQDFQTGDDYEAYRLLHEEIAQDVFGDEATFDLWVSQTRNSGPRSEQPMTAFEQAMEYDQLHLGLQESVLNIDYGTPHFTAEGSYLAGVMAAQAMLTPGNISIGGVDIISDTQFDVHFDGIQGEIAMSGATGYGDLPMGGAHLYRASNGFDSPVDLIDFEFIDADTIRYTTDEAANFDELVFTMGRHRHNWNEDLPHDGREYGGTNLYDTGQTFEVPDAADGTQFGNQFLWLPTMRVDLGTAEFA